MSRHPGSLWVKFGLRMWVAKKVSGNVLGGITPIRIRILCAAQILRKLEEEKILVPNLAHWTSSAKAAFLQSIFILECRLLADCVEKLSRILILRMV